MSKVLRLNKGAEECLLEFLRFLLESEKVKASFEKGVLKIFLPKTEEAGKKDIRVEVK